MRTLLILAAVPALVACSVQMGDDGPPGIQGTGSGNARDYAVGGFNKIEATGTDNVVVQVGGQPSVHAEGDPSVLERLVIRVDGNTLSIGRRNDWSGSNSGSATIRVTVPALQGASITGTGDMRISPLTAERFEASVTGTGDMTLDRIEGQSAIFNLTGTGNVQATGRVRQAEVSITGTGTGGLANLETETAEISVTGPGDAQIKATGTANVRIMGPGDVTVTGGARCTVNQMGPGEARCS